MNAPKKSRTPWVIGGAALAAVVVAVVVIVVAGGGDESDDPPATTTDELTVDDIPEGSIAFVEDVPDGAVTQEDYDTAFAMATEAAGLKEPPVEGDPEFELYREQALSDVTLPIWVRGEAAERGVEASETEIDQQLETTIEENFKSKGEFEEFVVDQGFCTEEELEAAPVEECERVIEETELQLVSEQIQEELLGDIPPDDFEQQQEATVQFEAEFTERWRARTICAEEFVTDRCSNGPEPPDVSEAVPPGGVPPSGAPPGAAPGAPGAAPGAPPGAPEPVSP